MPLVFDIETGPLPDEEVVADLDPYPEFDPEAVKMGNIKDPEKRKAKLLQAEVDHQKAALAYFQKALAGAALSGWTGQLLTFTWDKGHGVRQLHADEFEDESEFLFAVWARLENPADHPLVGYNCVGFDLPFLKTRSWVNRVPMPSWALEDLRYKSHYVIDLMRALTHGEYQQFLSLERAARRLGLPGKETKVTGATFAETYADPATRPAALEYAEQDVIVTLELYKTIYSRQSWAAAFGP